MRFIARANWSDLEILQIRNRINVKADDSQVGNKLPMMSLVVVLSSSIARFSDVQFGVAWSTAVWRLQISEWTK
jgi:hypothetical protein